jgi:transposase
LKIHDALADKIHVDTTNKSVQGAYDGTPLENFDITYGDPKSKRRDLKQLNIGLCVQQCGLPVGGNALSGNKSDAIWFREAMQEMNTAFEGDLNTMPICIFDAAGSSEETYKQANNDQVPTIIRQSDSFKMNKTYTDKAWEEAKWTVIDKNGNILEKEGAKKLYKLRSFDINFERFPWRLIVIYSSELKKLKEATAKRNFEKNKETILSNFKKISKKDYDTYDEAYQAGNQFVEKNISLSRPYKYKLEVEKVVQEKYAKKGKPGKNSEKVVTVKYQARLSIEGRDDELYEKWLKRESCFVLVSNIPKERRSDEQIFADYKAQWLVEDKFKFLKDPLILGPIWLQSKARIKGLIFVLLLAVVVNMYMCYRLMISFKSEANKELPDTQFEDINSKQSSNCLDNDAEIKEAIENNNSNTNCRDIDIKNSIKDNFEDTSAIDNHSEYDFERVLENDNVEEEASLNSSINKTQKNTVGVIRSVINPTYKTIKRLLSPLKTIIKLDQIGNTVRKFAPGTNLNLFDMIKRMGFDPLIYLKQYNFKMDLWNLGECNARVT